MKYIRTKNGIEQALYGEEFYEGKSYFYKTEYRWVYGDTYHKVKVKTYAKNGITKIADAIEELIDEKVAVRKRNHKSYLGHFSGPSYFQEDTGWLGRIDSYEIIYGAIWTDKGLIYKAKMKGVLPNGEIDWELL